MLRKSLRSALRSKSVQPRQIGIITIPNATLVVAQTTQVQEIEGYGHAGERLLPPDTGNGFVWRLRSVARYEEREGGLYVELEAVALTRDIPTSLLWFVSPVLSHLSTASLATTLRQMREAVKSPRHPAGANRVVSESSGR